LRYEKQLGEKRYVYGFLQDRIEQYIAAQKFEIGNYKLNGYPEEEEYIVIQDSWTNFAENFHSQLRADVLSALKMNMFSKVKIYRHHENGERYFTEYPFFQAYLTGRNCKRISNMPEMKNIKETIIDKVEIRIFKPIYDGILDVMKGEKHIEGSRGYLMKHKNIPVYLNEIKNTFDEICNNSTDLRLKYLKSEMEKYKVRYSDSWDVLACLIIDKFRRGAQNRKADIILIKSDEWYTILYHRQSKNKPRKKRTEIILMILERVLAFRCETPYPFESITLNERWEIVVKLKADI
jgi:hypothetical protein